MCKELFFVHWYQFGTRYRSVHELEYRNQSRNKKMVLEHLCLLTLRDTLHCGIETRTQYEANHGAEVASPTAKVEEGEARVEIQSLHHLRVYTWSRQMDVSMSPSQVLTTTTTTTVC